MLRDHALSSVSVMIVHYGLVAKVTEHIRKVLCPT